MDTAQVKIRDEQQATWDRFSAGWQKWDEIVLASLAPVGDALLEAARLTPTSQVLDVAAGTGEPGLSAAARAPKGKVIVTDLAAKMLRVAEENAARRGLRNVETRQADVTELPFADATFDAVTARFGFMFFPDMAAASRELARVARPGGRVTTAVWAAPERNPWATIIMSTIAKNVELPAPPPGAPGLFRCAAPGLVAGLFREAGLRNVTEVEVPCAWEFRDAEEYFALMTEVAAPVVAGLAKADAAARARIKETVLRLASQHAASDKIRLAGSAIVVTGEK